MKSLLIPAVALAAVAFVPLTADAAGGHHAKHAGKGGVSSFSKLDANTDGSLSLAEYTAKPHHTAAKFAAMDTDHDGKVTAAEFAAASQKHGKSHKAHHSHKKA